MDREAQGVAAPDVEPEGVRVLRRILDEGFAQGRTEIVDELFAPDLVEHQFGMAATGAEALERVRRAMTDLHSMAPDIHYTIEDWAERDGVSWVRVTARGTLTGSFFGPPSGRPFEITVLDVARVVDGKLVEHWGVPDRFALLAQGGVLDRLREPAA
jgi:predicted ester cyclase